MSKFFAIYNQEKEVYQLQTSGIIAVIVLIIALIALALILQPKEVKSKKTSAKQLVFSGAAMALAIVTSMLKVFEMPMGGSVTLFSMFFIVLIGYLYGARAGLMTGFAYGLLQFLIEPVFYTVPQMIVDYPLAFGALGLSGFFSNKKYGLQIGYTAGIFGRFVFAFLSGLLFFAEYAEGSGMSAPVYSMMYNGSYIGAEGIITLILLSMPPVSYGLKYIKNLS